jgi:hypothetical protein
MLILVVINDLFPVSNLIKSKSLNGYNWITIKIRKNLLLS